MNQNRSKFGAASSRLTFGEVASSIVIGASLITEVPAVAKRTVLRGGVFVSHGRPTYRRYAQSPQVCGCGRALSRPTAPQSGSVPAMIGAGWAQGKLFKLDAANANFDKALAKNPSNPMAHAGKAMVLFNRPQSSSQTIIKSKDAF